MKNSRETLYSKGDNRRPENSKKFADNYDRIFGADDSKAERKDRKALRARKRGQA